MGQHQLHRQQRTLRFAMHLHHRVTEQLHFAKRPFVGPKQAFRLPVIMPPKREAYIRPGPRLLCPGPSLTNHADVTSFFGLSGWSTLQEWAGRVADGDTFANGPSACVRRRRPRWPNDPRAPATSGHAPNPLAASDAASLTACPVPAPNHSTTTRLAEAG